MADDTTNALRAVADKLIVAANNPASHGGLDGLRRIMLARAADLHALATAQTEPQGAVGDAIRMTWLLVQSNGGRLTVSADTIRAFNAEVATLERFDNMDGSITFAARGAA